MAVQYIHKSSKNEGSDSLTLPANEYEPHIEVTDDPPANHRPLESKATPSKEAEAMPQISYLNITSLFSMLAKKRDTPTLTYTDMEQSEDPANNMIEAKGIYKLHRTYWIIIGVLFIIAIGAIAAVIALAVLRAQDSANETSVTSPQNKGKTALKWALSSTFGDFGLSLGMAVTKSGIIITEWANHKVVHISTEGKMLGMIGQRGWGKGEFTSPSGVGVLGNLVYVADVGNSRVVRLEIQDNGTLRWKDQIDFNVQVSHIAICPNSTTVYVTGGKDSTASIMEIQGNKIMKTYPAPVIAKAQRSYPRGIACHQNRFVAFADFYADTVEIFTVTSAGLMYNQTLEMGFNLPFDVEFHPKGHLLVVDEKKGTFGLQAYTWQQIRVLFSLPSSLTFANAMAFWPNGTMAITTQHGESKNASYPIYIYKPA